jgi:hypothetical protein
MRPPIWGCQEEGGGKGGGEGSDSQKTLLKIQRRSSSQVEEAQLRVTFRRDPTSCRRRQGKPKAPRLMLNENLSIPGRLRLSENSTK